jgi:hypothetical protein
MTTPRPVPAKPDLFRPSSTGRRRRPAARDDPPPARPLNPADQLLAASYVAHLEHCGADRDVVTPLLDERSRAAWLDPLVAHLYPHPRPLPAGRSEDATVVEPPEWVRRFDETTVGRIMEERGGWEADHLAIELRLVDAAPVALLLRIDHERSSTVADASLLSAELGVVLDSTAFGGGRRTPWWAPLSPADLRARLDHATSHPRPPLGVAPHEGVQPIMALLAWLIRRLPEGGTDYEPELLSGLAESVRSDRRRQPRWRGYQPRGPEDCTSMELRLRHGLHARGYGSKLLDELRALTGGDAALAALDDVALPDEPFDRTGIDDDVLEQVEQVLRLCDLACDQLFDVEIRTATRRLLHRVATQNPATFRRGGSGHTAAAGLVVTVARRNHRIAKYMVQAKQVHQLLAVSGSSSSRSASMLRTAGLDQRGDAPEFDARYLTGKRRAALIHLRDLLGTLEVYRLQVTLDGIEPPITRTVDVLGYSDLGQLHQVLQSVFGWEGTRVAEFRIGRYVVGTDATFDPPHRVADPWWPAPFSDAPAAPESADDTGETDGAETGRPARHLAVHRPDPGRWRRPAGPDAAAGEDDELGDWYVDEDEAEMSNLMLGGLASEGDTFEYRYGTGDTAWVHRITVVEVMAMGTSAPPCPHLVAASRAAPPEDLGGPTEYGRLLEVIGTDREHLAADVPAWVTTPVLAGTFDPWRPDPERTDAERLQALLAELMT